MKYNNMSRRMFLQGAGSLLPIPFLASMLPRELWAQGSGAAVKRYIGISSSYDYGRHSNWYPSMDLPGMTLNPGNGDRAVRYAPLSSYLTSSTASLSRIFGNHLNSNIGSVNLLRGLDQSTRIAHGQGHIFGNFRDNDNHESNSSQCAAIRTIDQVLRDSSQFNPINKDVAVMGNGSRSWRRDSSGNITRANTVSNSLRGTYNYLFNNGNLPESTGMPGGTTAHPRVATLNTVMEDYTRIAGSRQLSNADRTALNNAMDLLSDIHAGLQGTTTPSTGSCSHRSLSSSSNSSIYYIDEASMRVFANLTLAAIMCDVTRVFMWNGWVNEDLWDRHPTEDFHQGHSHIPFTTLNGQVNWQYMGDVQAAFVRSFVAPLVNGLGSANDPSNGRTYLYNSLVHMTVECSQVHGLNYQPCMLAGNAGGALTTGHLIDYTDRTRVSPWVADNFNSNASDSRFSNEYVGVPMNRVFNTILQSLGVPAAQYENPNINTHFQNVSNARYGSSNNGIASMGGYGHWGPSSSSYGQDYLNRSALYNLHNFKRTLPFPSSSST